MSRMASEDLVWQARKVARYSRLYGVSRTAVKVRSYAHMNRHGNAQGSRYTNSTCKVPDDPRRIVAIIGCGNFAYSTLAYYLRQEEAAFLRATLDLKLERAASLCSSYGGAYATTELQHILADERIRLVFIASNHASHAEYAVACLEAGKAVHIEKPHAVTVEQLADLDSAMLRQPDIPVFLGYNRPRSGHFLAVQRALVSQSGPTMIDWFVGGHAIPEDHWYFSNAEGGRVLGNLCHWLDLSLRLIGPGDMFPCRLVPSSAPTSKSDFALTINCRDKSLVSISFSAKGHTFEGVREVMSAHRGSCLVLLRDFHETRIENGASRRVYRTIHRDHGHRANVLHSYRLGTGGSRSDGETREYIRLSGLLSLSARQALESGLSVTVEPTGELMSAASSSGSHPLLPIVPDSAVSPSPFVT